MTTYLVCFDISNDRLRTQVGKALLTYGQRVQHSVFEISVRTPAQFEKLKTDLRTEIDQIISENDEASLGDVTKIFFYSLCKHCRTKSKDINDDRIATFPAVVII